MKLEILSNGPIYNQKLTAYKRYIKNTPSSGINNYIEICKYKILEKQQ